MVWYCMTGRDKLSGWNSFMHEYIHYFRLDNEAF